MTNQKLGRPSKETRALMRGLVSDLLWFGKIETTQAKAKAVQSKAEKLLTLAINSYDDTVKVVKEIKDEKGVKVKKEVVQRNCRHADNLCLIFLIGRNKESQRKAKMHSRQELKA